MRRLWLEEDGMETVEYAITAGLIVGAAVVTIALIGTWAARQFQWAATDLKLGSGADTLGTE
jgi:Flp pilus assembly pilin Flp